MSKNITWVYKPRKPERLKGGLLRDYVVVSHPYVQVRKDPSAHNQAQMPERGGEKP